MQTVGLTRGTKTYAGTMMASPVSSLYKWQWHVNYNAKFKRSIHCIPAHYSDVKWVSWYIKSATRRLFHEGLLKLTTKKPQSSASVALCDGTPVVSKKNRPVTMRKATADAIWCHRTRSVLARKQWLVASQHQVITRTLLTCHRYGTVSLTRKQFYSIFSAWE